MKTQARKVWLSEAAADEITTASMTGHPLETGGVLIGVYTEGKRPWIIRAMTVRSDNAGRAHFELPAGARPACIDTARKVDPRLGYLGDWHSHPADVGASETDLATMRNVALDRKAAISRPLLLIARRSRAGNYEFDLHEFIRGRPRTTRLITAGGLSPAPHEDVLDAA